MKAATRAEYHLLQTAFISIHAAREGGDRLFAPCSHCVNISIHAAREGGDLTSAGTLIAQIISIHAAREGGDN